MKLDIKRDGYLCGLAQKLTFTDCLDAKSIIFSNFIVSCSLIYFAVQWRK